MVIKRANTEYGVVSRKPISPEGQSQLRALGQAVRSTRKARDVSQEALAHLAEIDRSHMGKIERGERNVTALNLFRIAEALKIRPSEILSAAGL